MTKFEFAAPLFFLLLPTPMVLWSLSNYLSIPTTGLLLPPAFLQKFKIEIHHQSSIYLFWKFITIVIAWLGIIIGLADPRVPDAVTALPISGRDIILAIDLSGSMAKHDFELNGASVSRLDLVKHVASDLIQRREGDRIGLVIFAEKTYAASPLSFDVRAVANTLKELEIGLVGRSTAIGEGLGLSLKRLMNSTVPTRIVILLSDGANNAGSSQPTAVAELSRQIGVKIFTIGLGEDNAKLLSDSRDAVDFVTLENVARIGGGTAFLARSGADLDRAMRLIEEMIAGPASAPPRVIYHDLWIYPVILSFFALSIVGLATRTTR
jgi:Ca-activated chloride channel homolog